MCSKKVAGIALTATGVILIVVGVIVGVLLTNMAQKAIEDSTCVNSKDSSGYKRWEGPSYITTKVYIWNITNKDGFLYRGEKPKLKETGPYVYSTKSKQVYVKFENGKVTSTSFDQAKFNKTLTEKECPTCTEHDKLTILNAAYLGLMEKVRSAKDFSTASIPLVLTLLFRKLNAETRSQNASFIQMGKAHNQLGFNSTTFNPAFGSWVNSKDSFSPIHGNFSLRDMSGLYSALTNASKFGPFTNPSLLARCMSSSALPTQDCGLAINLATYVKDPQVAALVKPNIDRLLCPHAASSCFDTSNNVSIPAIAQFITDPLPKYVLWYLEDQNYGLTTTRQQSDIIIGYVMTKLPFPPQYRLGIPVPGAVDTHTDEQQAKAAGTNSTFYTCESTEGDRFTYAAVGGENKVNKALYPNASQEQLKVRGYYVQFPGQESLKPCTTKYTRLASSYELFMTKFRFAVPIDYKKDVEVHQIPMHRYVLGKSAVEVNNVTVFTQGVFDVTRIFGGPMYISLPGFLYGEPSLYEELNLPKPDVKKHESFLSIEPVSGTAMELNLRIQLNGVILPQSLSSNHQRHLNVSYVNKLIPIWWSETTAGIDADSAKKYSSELFGGLRLSCGLLVAFPVIGGILLIVGVVLIVLAVKKGTSVTTA